MGSSTNGLDLRGWRVCSVVVAAAAAIAVATIFLPKFFVGHPVAPAGATAFALSAAFAAGALLVCRRRPGRRSVNRALTHSIVTTVVLASYAAIVAVLTALVEDHEGVAVALGAAGLVAFAAQPMHSLIQRRLDARLFGGLGDPYRVITGLARRLETTALPEDVLPGVVETVAHALHLPYVAIELQSQSGPVVVASTGTRNGATTRLPLVHQAEMIGWLVLGTRSPRERLTGADLRLLQDLARQIGVAARGVQLVHDLEQSRSLLVAAREEERRRLQRNLHDGLGPMLAGISLAVQAARNMLASDPAAADAVLERAVGDCRTATDDVRRLVYDLRPPALDRLGLAGALREQVDRLQAPTNGNESRPLAVAIEGVDDLGPLPPAVELAAYRIALEAFVNVNRHAHASTCTIRMMRDAHVVVVDVVDDGEGIGAGSRPGVGIMSMSHRAMELGGSCTLTELDGGGAHVHAELPMPVVNFATIAAEHHAHTPRRARTAAP